MSTASATDIVKYLGSMSSMLSKGDRTASGETDDKTPEELPQKEGMAALSTDGRAIANAVFTSVHAKMPAELLAMSDAYDATQACTRMAKLYNRDRKDFYDLASRDLDTRKSRLAYKQGLILAMLSETKEAKAAQITAEAQTTTEG